jgi:hypothetical protein
VRGRSGEKQACQQKSLGRSAHLIFTATRLGSIKMPDHG